MAALCSARGPGRFEPKPEEGPRRAGWGSQEDLPGRDPGGGRRSLAELAGAVGHGLSQDRGAVGDQSLCSLGVPASSSTSPPLPLHHEPAGTARQGGEEADQGGGSVL